MLRYQLASVGRQNRPLLLNVETTIAYLLSSELGKYLELFMSQYIGQSYR